MTPPQLACPDCAARIGNNRGGCVLCNRFAQSVMRHTRARIKAAYPDEYDAVRAEVEQQLYAELTENRSTVPVTQ